MNKPLKLLMLINNLDIGNRGGGAETFAINLGLELHQAGIDVIIGILSHFNSTNEARWIEKLNQTGIPYAFLNPGPRRDLVRSYNNASAICREQSPEIIHSHCQIGSVIAVNLKAHKLVHSIIRTAHAGLEWGSGPLGFFARSVFTRWIFPRSFDAQVGVNDSIRRKLDKYLQGKQRKSLTKTIYNAIPRDLQNITANIVIPRQFPRGEKWEIISVGRLARQKGYEDLLAALPAVFNQRPDVHVSIVGEGKQRSALNNLAKKLGISQHITLTGQRTDITDLLLHSDLFVLPSHSEGLPTVILEAMACGLPVIATKLPGVTEVIRDKVNGWLVSPANPPELSAAILHALEFPDDLKRVCSTALKDLSVYSMDTATHEYIRLYQTVIKRGQSIAQ